MVERTPLAAPTVELGDELPPIDPSKPAIISAWGRKGSGKSVFNRRLFDSWPWDKLAIDVNGDADPGPDATKVTTPLPGRFPAPPEPVPGGPRPGPRTLVFRADPGAPTYADDLDRAVGMALFPQAHKTLVWCGEIGEFMPTAQRTGPHMRRLLMQNRHYHTTALFDGPRPMNVNPLVLAQSDLVAIFHLPNPADQERVADTIGYPPARFHEECETTWRRGKYWFLLWHAEAHALYRCAPLPPLER
ncbi:hypothetical protein [Cellulomonas sp. 73-145]|uniref:hypothetical protein n=1 Tax=Cellulomonas sp. 73-145 TaxID=1895739 RepID=UPI0025B8BD22|nr:hypothetical protein [Cellulomonas sp. 73-145]